MSSKKQTLGEISTFTPIGLITFAIKESIAHHFRLYLYLKLLYPEGKIANYHLRIDEICRDLQILKLRTFNSHIIWLTDNYWISIDKKNTLFIRSYKSICTRYSCKFSPAALLEFDHLKNFRGWCGAALFSRAIKQVRYLRSIQRSNKSRSVQVGIAPQVACLYVSILHNISIDKIKYVKHCAIKAGYLTSSSKVVIVANENHAYGVDLIEANMFVSNGNVVKPTPFIIDSNILVKAKYSK